MAVDDGFGDTGGLGEFGGGSAAEAAACEQLDRGVEELLLALGGGQSGHRASVGRLGLS